VAPPRAPEPPAVRRQSLTFRAVLIALLLTPLNSLWLVHTEIVRYSGHPTTTSLFFNVIFCLSVLVALNALLTRYWPRAAFSQGELLVVFTLLSLGSAMVGHDMLQVLIATLVHPFWYATESNRWQALFFDALPRWLMVDDREALRGYFLGNTSFYRPEFFLVWLKPIAIWTAFFMVLIFMMMCLNVVWRRQWTENERLTFPIIQLPLQMTDERFTLFRTRNLWIGFCLAAAIDTLNTLHANFPAWPSIPIRDIQLQQYLLDRPWSAIGWTPLGFFPFVVGLGFLLPLELLFSCWFFYLYWKAQMVVTAAYGWNEGRVDFPYIAQQSSGAYLGVCIFVVWISRGYLREVLGCAFSGRSRGLDVREPMSYRAAVFGFLIGFAALVVFSMYAGIPPGVGIAFFVLYFMISIAVDRMRAEVGSPAHDLHHAGPDQILTEVYGASAFNKATLAAFSLYWGFNRAYRTHPMPHQLEGFRLAQLTGMPLRPWMWVMLLASFWGTLCAFWALLHVYYDLGAGTAKMVGPSTYFGWEPYRRLAEWTGAPRPRDPLETWFLGGGFAFSVFLTGMRMAFLWWPFHPVGLAVSSSWAMNYMWFPLFIAWVAKTVVLRGSGLKGYRIALPFFLGLVLGEFVVGGFWNLVGLIFELEIYRFWG
jgi:hypothetical protein